MAQPQWITPAGELETIPEGVFYSRPLEARDPDGGDVFFELIAGQLPEGIQVRTNGAIEGTPKSIANVQGVPQEVSQDITSKFAVRAYTVRTIDGQIVKDRINDRTFTITVTGQDIPDFVTPGGLLGQYFDGTEVDLQIEFTDPDPDDRIRIRVLTGELPPGLTLDPRTGRISGVIIPLIGPPGSAQGGYDDTAYAEYPFDFATRSASKAFQFSLEITDGKDSNVRAYSIYVWSKDSMSADTTDATADNTFITADVSPTRTPILLTPEGDLGRIRADNFYAFKFDAIDFDGGPVVYELTTGSGIGYDPASVVGKVKTLSCTTVSGNSFLTIDLVGGVVPNAATQLFVGMAVSGRGITPGTQITSILGANIGLSAPVTSTANSTITFYGKLPSDTAENGNPGSFDRAGEGFDRGNFSLPPGLELNQNTGWFTGYIPNQGATEQTYRFAIRVRKANDPGIISDFYYFTMTIIGNVDTEVIWLTPEYLGTINNGAISTFYVEAVNTGGRSLEYRLASGTDSALPQGLTLLPSGHIAGKVSFNTFALDGGTTTFDVNLNTRLDIDETTFDLEFDFTVNVYAPQTEDPGYQVAAILVTNGGSNYGTVNVTFDPPPPGPGSITATGVVTVVDGKVTAVGIQNAGSGYTSPPTITFDAPPGTGITATATAVMNGDRVASVTITNVGSGYAMPTVTLSAPPNSIDAQQATAGSITIVGGEITSIGVGNPGRGYASPPSVTITGAGGAGAVASATAEIINVVNAVSAFRRFTIRVVRAFNEPYEKLYIKAMPPLEDRVLIDNLVMNQDIIPRQLVYRADDPNFGVAKSVVYDHAYGLTAATLDAYAEAMDFNHYWKNLTLGEIKTARALDANGNVLYEVIYSQIIDDQVNNQGESVDKVVKLPFTVETDDGQETDVVYPNSLINMRDQVIDQIGQISPALPAWMTSKQTDGRVLGFVPAWVIAYVKPGQGNRVLYNVQTQFGVQLNKVDFKADRYELDRSLTKNWDPSTDNWVPSPALATTFDRFTRASGLIDLGNVDYATTLGFSEINYRPLTYIRDRGGVDGAFARSQLNNRTVVFFKQEDFVGLTPDEAFTDYYIPYGDGEFSADDSLYDAARILSQSRRLSIYRMIVGEDNLVRLVEEQATTASSFVQVLSGETFAGEELYIPTSPNPGFQFVAWTTLEQTPAQETIFDGNSTRFIAPADQYNTTDVFDKYLLYPKTNILGGQTTIPDQIIPWTNDLGQQVLWTNNSGRPVTWVSGNP